jgi:hypothetical protein
MNLPPTPRNLARSAAMRGLPRHKGFDAAFDAVCEAITADPSWEAEFTAATAEFTAATTDPRLYGARVSLRSSIDAHAEAVDAACIAYNKASQAGRDMTAAEAALDAAGDASEQNAQGQTLCEQGEDLLKAPADEPELVERTFRLCRALDAATLAYRRVRVAARAAATQPPAPAPAPVRRALADNLTDTRAAALGDLDDLFKAAQEARRALNAASAAYDAARAASAAADQALAAAYDAARAR